MCWRLFVVVYVFVAGGMHLRIAAAKPLRGHQASAGQHLLQLPGHLHQAKLRPPCRAPPPVRGPTLPVRAHAPTKLASASGENDWLV